MNFFERLIEFGAGHRTEILTAIYTIIRMLAVSGVIPNHIADSVGEVIRPAAAMTLAAKVSRLRR